MRDYCARWDTRRGPFLGGVGALKLACPGRRVLFSTIPSRPAFICAQSRRGGCHTVQRLARHPRREGAGEVPRIDHAMLYWLLYQQLFSATRTVPVLGRSACFRYVTFRTAFASLTALFLCILIGPWLIRKLREFQIGQHIREEGPKSHQKKAGTPTMGGVLIIISIVVPTLLWADLRNPYVWVALFGLLSFGAIGFYDDYTKVRKKRNLGLTARQKFGLQVLGRCWSSA